MINYFGKGQTAMNKTVTIQPTDSATTAIAFWTSTATAKPVITDYSISAYGGGTVVIKFGSAASSSIVAQHIMSSSTVTWNRETPLVGDTNGGIFFIESAFGGYLTINAQGFEY